MDVVELNEAFASQALACVKNVVNDPYLDGFQEMWDTAKVNPYGGAMALGHPMGATGAFLTCKVLDYLQDPETAGKYGMVTMCIGGGMRLRHLRALQVITTATNGRCFGSVHFF